MAGLEELMAGLFGEMEAAGLEEMRRRRAGPGSGGGYEGIGGAMVMPGQMAPFWGGLNQYDFSGAMGAALGGRQGLMSLLGDRDPSGPALRHFARQGFDFMPPGQDNRERPGGPNVAPGNIDNGQALDQPQGNLTPGVPQGVARGYESAPGQVKPRPQTQGWRNIHPGYSATAAYGTDPSGRPVGFAGGAGGGRPVGAPAAASGLAPGAAPGGHGIAGFTGGGGGRGPSSQNPIGGGPGPVRPGVGGGGTGGGQSSGGKQTGGGGGGVTPQVQQQANAQSTARGGRPAQQVADQRAAANIAKGAGGKQLGGSPMLDALGAIQNLGNQPKPPNRGNNNTPSEMGGGQRWSDTHEAKYANETPAEKKARLAAKAQRQEAARLKAAPPASNFGNRAQGGTSPIVPVLNAPLSQKALEKSDPRGSGTAPIPDKGKTKPKSSTSKQQR